MANKATNYFWKKSDGKLYARITFEKDGERRQKTKIVKSGKLTDVAGVVDELRKKLSDPVVKQSGMLSEFLDSWLSTVKQVVKYKTYTMYEYLVRCHIRPFLGEKELQKIKAPDVQAFITDMRQRGFSAKTVRETYRVVKRVFQQAVDWELRVNNPALKIEIPKKVHNEMKCLTSEEAEKFLDEALKDSMGVLFHFALKTGMRPGEYLGLRWSDLDLKSKRVTVQRAVVDVEKGLDFDEPKTAKGRRTISLSGSLVALLEQHRRQQPEEFRFGKNLVFHNKKGEVLDRRNLERRNFKRILKCAKLPDIRLYDLRHAHATLLLASGVNPKVVSERLGHANVAFTMDVYTHILPSMQEEATEKLEKILKQE